MSKENWEIQFIKPCRFLNEEHRLLTPEYTYQSIAKGRMVQINLDNCSIQRMEELTEDATVRDVEAVGLLPLYEILQNGMISLTCIGINEMPDWRVKNAEIAYERFCRKFWPGHKNDKEATRRKYDPESKERKVKFAELSEGARSVYGIAYVAILQIQNIHHNYSSITPEKRFEIYLHSMIGLLNIVSGFELEIAKWAFWELNMQEINQLTPTIKERRRDIRENFAKVKNTISKCQEFAFDAAMDLHWLSGANFSEDFGHDIEINGTRLKLDNWIGTNDHKLYRISRCIHSTYYENSTMKRLAITREKELSSNLYWRNVDEISKEILSYRYHKGYSVDNKLLIKIDMAVTHIEKKLVEKFSEVI
ncbi:MULTISPECIES: hypothetical protein [Acinetobacter]|uniref:hypothetical protein n=3 Tax=Moraxellaceae TaxID=468 RepID=UPI000BDF450A|nr:MULTISPECIES: hypothetical protein [Acinetobacter]